MLAKPKAILFDWDETLVNSWEAIRMAVNHTRERYGLITWSEEESHQNINKSLRDSFPDMFGDEWESAAAVFRQFVSDTHLNYLSAKPGVEDLLLYLRTNQISCGLVSNKLGPILRKEIIYLGWEKFFPEQVICGAEDGPHDKPHPECWSLIKGHFKNQTGKDLWYVGDKLIDMEFAHNINATAVLVGKTQLKNEFYPWDAATEDCIQLKNLIKNAASKSL